MRLLALARYAPITIAELVDCWRERKAPPRRAVVITFDDGFRDCVEFAVPVLERYRFRAVFYLVAGLMGQTSRWMRAAGGAEFPLMDWTAARAPPGRRHAMRCPLRQPSRPGRLLPGRGQEGAGRVTAAAGGRLGVEVVHFAYPYGSVSPQVRALAAEAGYLSACATDRRLATSQDDLLRLPRVPVYGGESLIDFVCRLRTAESPRTAVRTLPRPLLRKARRRGP